MNYAVIDLGSNTIRLSVFRYKDKKIITVIRQKEVAGLAGYIKDKELERDGIRKACEVLNNFKEIAVHFVDKNEIHVFATAALRNIDNRDQAIKIIKETTDLMPVVLSGKEEAELDFIGASHYTKCHSGLLIDIGGASTELVHFEDSRPVDLASMPIGCLSLYSRFVDKFSPTKKECQKLKKEIVKQLDKLKWDPEQDFPLMIGIGGTVRGAYKLSRQLFSLPADKNDIDTDLIEKILYELNNNEDSIYHVIYKVIPERSLTIFPGLMILNEVIKRFSCEKLFISGFGVREGYLIQNILNKGDIINAKETS